MSTITSELEGNPPVCMEDTLLGTDTKISTYNSDHVYRVTSSGISTYCEDYVNKVVSSGISAYCADYVNKVDTFTELGEYTNPWQAMSCEEEYVDTMSSVHELAQDNGYSHEHITLLEDQNCTSQPVVYSDFLFFSLPIQEDDLEKEVTEVNDVIGQSSYEIVDGVVDEENEVYVICVC